jgi:NAD(P)-dependent dehydrogenase (short-subunit alcohol dehydrogenase family)
VGRSNGDRLGNKVVIVTGASGGIGRALVQRFASEGARLVLADLDLAKSEALAAELPGGGDNHLPIVCDVRDEGSVEVCARSALAQFGKIDVVVNNAGVMSFRPLADCTTRDWLKVFEANLFGAAYFVTQALRHADDGGSVINISSVHALMTSANVAPYAAAKAGLLSLTRSAAIEGRAKNIRCNAIVAGAIDTPMLWDNPNVRSGAEIIHQADVGTPADIANAALFLASDESRFVTGAVLAVDGGRLVRL